MTSSIVRFAAEETERHLPMPPIMYGVVAIAVLLSLLLITFAYRNVHTRHR